MGNDEAIEITPKSIWLRKLLMDAGRQSQSTKAKNRSRRSTRKVSSSLKRGLRTHSVFAFSLVESLLIDV
jgi:hypothetical protein